MSAAHTAGPWTVRQADAASNGVRYWINSTEERTADEVSQPHGLFVAQVGSGLRAEKHRDRVAADAQLIAAAPELLEACESARDVLRALRQDSGGTFEQIERAIAKAVQA